MSYIPWFERRPDLLEQEIRAFRENGLEFELDDIAKEDLRTIIFRGVVIFLNEEEVEFELVYPSEFPAIRIIVKVNNISIDRHQNPFEKNLCVIPHDQTGWESWMTGAYMVNQAIRLLQDTNTGEEQVATNEVDSPEPWSNYIQFRWRPLLIPQHLPDNLKEIGTYTISGYIGHFYEYKDVKNPLIQHHYVLEVINQLGETIELEKPFSFQENQKNTTIEGVWFHLPKPPSFNLYDTKEVIDKLNEVMGEKMEIAELHSRIVRFRKMKPKERKKYFPPNFSFIFDEENYERNQYRKAFIWGVYDFDNHCFHFSSPQYITKDEHFRRIPELTSLDNKKVLITGLGSLGSAVAIELGKSGVGSFVLVDKDVLEVGNLVRHTGTMEYVGMSKTKLLEQQILSHYPFTNIELINQIIGYEVEKMDELFDKVNDVDMVINLTAEESVIKILNRLCLESKTPVIHAWISNGAWGGRVIRTLPYETGCYYCYLASENMDIASSPESEIYPRGCGFPTFSGASFDIYEVATHTARMTIGTLLKKSIDYDHIVVNHYPQPNVEVYKIKRISGCPLCGDNTL
ncbi:HesA/MoeB/ThiF family protein [Bacillus sp. DJP31]|uniref:HesA/MoeB/ThiF family protein n=1 Tax=Bacillus sp. DJP31 TaxID=3409789 RepID=UPI003BB66946